MSIATFQTSCLSTVYYSVFCTAGYHYVAAMVLYEEKKGNVAKFSLIRKSILKYSMLKQNNFKCKICYFSNIDLSI
jgi:hypothetical protein